MAHFDHKTHYLKPSYFLPHVSSIFQEILGIFFVKISGIFFCETPLYTRCLRQILKIPWYAFVSNRDVLARAGCDPLANILRARRLRWAGHVARMAPGRLPRSCLRLKPLPGWRKKAGGQRLTWEKTMEKDLKLLGWTMEDICLGDLAANRARWRGVIRDILMASQGRRP